MPHCLVVLIPQLLVLLLHCSLSNWFWGFSYLIGNGSFLLKSNKKINMEHGCEINADF